MPHVDRLPLPRASRALSLVLFVLAFATATADEPRDGPKKEKPAAVTLVNKAKDIRVIAERDEAIRDYFQRNHIIIGGVQAKELKKVLDAKEPLAKVLRQLCLLQR